MALADFSEWDPVSPDSWARVLGLVHVPMFGSARPAAAGQNAVLVDGHRASFAIVSGGPASDLSREPLDWSWSAYLNHVLLIDSANGAMTLRRWDRSDSRKFRLPKTGQAAREMLGILEAAAEPRSADVVLHLLRAFREIRRVAVDPLNAIHLLNALLLGTEGVRLGRIEERDWLRAQTVTDALGLLPEPDARLSGVREVPAATKSANISSLLRYFITPEPLTTCRLEPDLLLRHAASQLYQEAHLAIERDPQLPLFIDASHTSTAVGVLHHRDVRFTPPSLARTLAQQALRAAGARENNDLDILDPACGSGVFLQEALRELVAAGFTGKVKLRGYDRSAISCAIAEFCLSRAKADLASDGVSVEVDILHTDALTEAWGNPNIVLMNPPFVAWDQMDADDQARTRETLGPLAKGRPDKAMAFAWKAAQSIRPGGAVATVLPAALLENDSGGPLREALSTKSTPLLVGRFEGTGYFRGAMVETAFLVYRCPPAHAERASVRMLLATEGSEDAGLRLLRLADAGINAAPPPGVELSVTAPSALQSRSWSPRYQHVARLTELLTTSGLPTLGTMFDVRQGARTGMNEAFIVGRAEWDSLPSAERKYFRPAAGNSTISNGRLSDGEYVFFPYGKARIGFEAELSAKVPTFYKERLMPLKDALRSRSGITEEWWRLTRERSWQNAPSPKLVSTYFGDRGSFAFDEAGTFVVVQGHALLWRSGNTRARKSEKPFSETSLPFAYLALLNSRVFESILACYCPRVQGGQYNLSKRFVDPIPLPNLSDDERITGGALETLAGLGHAINDGARPPEEDLDRQAALAYGLPVSEFLSVATSHNS